MNPNPFFRLATVAAFGAALAGCAGTAATTPTVARTPAPQNYDKTITNYLAFRIRSPQKNTLVTFGAPEPGDCPLDGYASSMRGWVVPVFYATRSGEALNAVNITAKQYYFWFLGNTIAGITPRIELCPGIGATLIDVVPANAASGFLSPALASPPAFDAGRRDGADVASPAQQRRSTDRAKSSDVQKKAGHGHRKSATSGGKVRRPLRKAGRAPAI